MQFKSIIVSLVASAALAQAAEYATVSLSVSWCRIKKNNTKFSIVRALLEGTQGILGPLRIQHYDLSSRYHERCRL